MADARALSRNDLIVVTGAGGFMGGHLLQALWRDGYKRLRGVDIKPVKEWIQVVSDADNRQLDLRRFESCVEAATGARQVYNLACDMGGMGFIETHKADCMISVLINTHMLMAARAVRVERFFYSSSACVYAADKQTRPDLTPLRESDAYPAMPEDGYGWEKLFSERMCRHFAEDFGLVTRIARYHNVYGPHGTYDGGREKAPAAVCRKVISAMLEGRRDIEIWGDGEQSRSFLYIDDCLSGTHALMASGVDEPLNIGSEELVTINQLVAIVERIAGVTLTRRYKLDAPLGVRGRCSDNTLVSAKLRWQPSVRLEDGMERTYRWIHDQMTMRAGNRHAYA